MSDREEEPEEQLDLEEEPEEQLDLEGDDDDDGYRRREDSEEPEDEYEENDDRQAGDDDEDRGEDDINEMDKEGDGGPEDAEEKQKWDELLALPPDGTQVFIGGLPRDVTEEDLRELCEPLGELYEVQLTKDKDTNENKGSAFVTFTDKDAAQRALPDIQGREFRGRLLRCSLSQQKNRLFVGNVPKGLSQEELTTIIESKGPGVVHIEMFKDKHDPKRNRGFLFVEYYNHACADYALHKLSSPSFKVDGSQLTVSWAEPKQSESSSAAAHVKTVYVKNLPEDVLKEKVKELFEKHGEVTKVVLPPPRAGQKKDFGFVHFAERSSALLAVKGSQKYEIDGHVLDVSMAKPITEKKPDPSHRPGGGPRSQPRPPFGGGGYMGDPYGAYGGPPPAFNQPMIYGRGPAPAGMRMVPMVLPDGRVGYVLQQPGGMPIPPPPRRGDRRDRGGGDRYRPY